MIFVMTDRVARRLASSLFPHILPICVLLVAGPILAPVSASAENIPAYFPSGSGGYDQQLGVTVLSRQRPLYATPGINVGGFVVNPNFDQAVLYNSNVNGVAGSGSWGTRTSASISASSDWVRNSLAASIGFSNNQFFAIQGANFTPWNVGLAAGYSIDEGLLGVAYSHQSTYTLGSTIAATRTQTPTLDQTDSAQVYYTFKYFDLTISPNVSASAYRFGTSTTLGQQFNQQFLDRDVIAAGVDNRYSLSDEGGLLFVIRGVNSNFVHPVQSQPSNNSNSLEILGGLDYQAQGPWRYRFLAGIEVRSFQARRFATRIAPIVEGSLIWTPTSLTTLTGTVSREIEDPLSAGTNGFIATQISLGVDHELLPNVFLQARIAGESIEFLQNGGQQTQISFGTAVNWLLSRNARVSLGYDYTTQSSGSSGSIGGTSLNSATLTKVSFKQSVIGLTLHLAL